MAHPSYVKKNTNKHHLPPFSVFRSFVARFFDPAMLEVSNLNHSTAYGILHPLHFLLTRGCCWYCHRANGHADDFKQYPLSERLIPCWCVHFSFFVLHFLLDAAEVSAFSSSSHENIDREGGHKNSKLLAWWTKLVQQTPPPNTSCCPLPPLGRRSMFWSGA